MIKSTQEAHEKMHLKPFVNIQILCSGKQILKLSLENGVTVHQCINNSFKICFVFSAFGHQALLGLRGVMFRMLVNPEYLSHGNTNGTVL